MEGLQDGWYVVRVADAPVVHKFLTYGAAVRYAAEFPWAVVHYHYPAPVSAIEEVWHTGQPVKLDH